MVTTGPAFCAESTAIEFLSNGRLCVAAPESTNSESIPLKSGMPYARQVFFFNAECFDWRGVGEVFLRRAGLTLSTHCRAGAPKEHDEMDDVNDGGTIAIDGDRLIFTLMYQQADDHTVTVQSA